MSVRSVVAAFLLLAGPLHADQFHGEVRAIIVDEAERPVAGATVILTAAVATSTIVGTERTGADGRATFRGLPAGSYSLLAVFGEARDLRRDVVLGTDERVEVRAVLPRGPEVITIRERPPAVTPPQPIKSTVNRVLPWSDEAVDTNSWAVGWALLQIDAGGRVSAFRFLHRPGRGLDEIATHEIWRLAFRPARDTAGRPVPSELLWRMEWPAYWWWQARHMSPGRMQLSRRLPPCRGSGPMNLDGVSSPGLFRDCSLPDLDRALTEPLIVRR